jgi:hypothetical protein
MNAHNLEALLARWNSPDGHPVITRILKRVVEVDGCWICSYAKDTSGYPQVSVAGRMMLVHRVTYDVMKGPIGIGLQIDHLCRKRDCCNPSHLEAVTSRENTMRGDTIPARNAAATACPHGHPRTVENTFQSDSKPGRQKRCRACHVARARSYKLRFRSAA